MKKLLPLTLLSFSFIFGQKAWINEIHYDNSGTDENEFIEIVLDSTANDTLAYYEINLYRDSGTTYGGKKTLADYTLGSTDSTFKIFYLVYPVNGIQNGPADGMCLSYKGTLIDGQFISYEGTLTASEGPANGLTSTDIGVAEIGTDPGTSLQLSGRGTQYSDFVWNDPQPETPGQINTNQVFKPKVILPEPSEHVTNFTVDSVSNSAVSLSWTGAAGAQAPDKYLILARTDAGAFPVVKDSVVIPNDADWTDGVAAQNVVHQDGANSYLFTGLQENTTYYFVIYPYTNSGDDIDYKTDPAAPETQGTTSATPLYAIATIRQDINTYKGQVVKIAGVVTATVSGKSEVKDGFFIQDQAQPWSGIYVGDNTYADSVSMGDSVTVTGTVAETYGLAQINSVTGLTVMSSSANMPKPYPVTSGTFADDQYVSLLVKVVEATCTNADLGYGEWELNDGSGAMRADDLIFAFTPKLNEIYTVIGPGYYAFSKYKIVPRSQEDIQLVTTAPIIKQLGISARVPAADQDFTDTVQVTAKYPLDKVELRYSVNHGAYQSVNMNTKGNDSTFAAAIPAADYNDGDAVTYWVFATNTNSDSTSGDSLGFFAGTTPLLSLKQIDDNKELIYKGFYARTSGVATVANGVLHGSHLSFNIQDDNYGAIRVFKYDEAAFTITPGHLYTVTGKLDQYRGLNQLAPDDVDTDIVDEGESAMPDPLPVTLANLLAGAEELESLLIEVQGADTLGSSSWPTVGISATMTISDDGGVTQLDLRIESSTDIDGNPEPVWPQNIVGVFSQYSNGPVYDDGYQIQPRAMSDFSPATAIRVNNLSAIPGQLALHPAYPNPFNPSTTIAYDIPAKLRNPDGVSLAIYNMLGQKIRVFQPVSSTGRHQVVWQGRSDAGERVASGIYFVVFRADGQMFSRKLLLMK